MNTLKVKVTGISPMIMHSDKLSNPLDPATKRHKEMTSKRKKTEDDLLEIARSEWMGSLYLDKEVGIYMPVQNVRKSLIEGARQNKLGKHIERGVVFMTDKAKLIYDGPKDVEKLWESGEFTDARTVVVSRARLMRYRPIFKEWNFAVEVIYDESVIDKRDIIMCWENAGRLIGLGDFRPLFGRHEVEEV
jgi:hypothetical protein